MNMVDGPLGKDGLTIEPLPTLFQALTKRAAGWVAWSRSRSDSLAPVK
jgi:hypothetical protein